MTLSVALCTYNGARFLPDQLASIATQERMPDELVICDDRSTDETVAVLERFRGTAPFPVRIWINPHNLGSTRNFAQALEQCSGEIIAFADQDDVWFPQKLRQLEEVLGENAATGFAFSDAQVVSKNSQPLGCCVWDTLRFHKRLQRQVRRGAAFDVLLRRNVVTGATMAFRSLYRSLVLPIPPAWVHDAWIALLISAVARAELIDQPLMQYRQHAAQQIGATRRTLAAQYVHARGLSDDAFERLADQFEAAGERLAAQRQFPVSPEQLVKLNEKVLHCRVRAQARRRSRVRRLVPVLTELFAGRYRRFSLDWRSALVDLLA